MEAALAVEESIGELLDTRKTTTAADLDATKQPIEAWQLRLAYQAG